MDWFFEKRGKSVASNAQRIVADMHKHLDIQTRKAKEMEDIMLKFRSLNVTSLEKEIERLHAKKNDLVHEMEDIDKSIIEATESLKDLQERMNKALQLPVPELTTGLNQVTSTSIKKTEDANFAAELKIQQAVKASHPNQLFYIHQNKIESIILFAVSINKEEAVECQFLMDYRDKEGRVLTSAEDTMYGVSIAPNHQRDFPHVTEMACPSFLEGISPGILVAAFEIALTSAVIIDAWQNNEGLVWATTSIDGHSFAVLERMYVVSEVSWGLQSIVQVDLCGRDSQSGDVVVEHVSATEDDD